MKGMRGLLFPIAAQIAFDLLDGRLDLAMGLLQRVAAAAASFWTVTL
jgi:hypothetical protein